MVITYINITTSVIVLQSQHNKTQADIKYADGLFRVLKFGYISLKNIEKIKKQYHWYYFQ